MWHRTQFNYVFQSEIKFYFSVVLLTYNRNGTFMVCPLNKIFLRLKQLCKKTMQNKLTFVFLLTFIATSKPFLLSKKKLVCPRNEALVGFKSYLVQGNNYLVSIKCKNVAACNEVINIYGFWKLFLHNLQLIIVDVPVVWQVYCTQVRTKLVHRWNFVLW